MKNRRNRRNGVVAMVCLSMVGGTLLLGCGGDSDAASTICAVEFADLAGTYSFKMTIGSTNYSNSCFENYDNPNPDPDPASFTNCTWTEEKKADTIGVDLVITDDGNIGSASVTSVTDQNGQVSSSPLGVHCEMLKGELCNAPVRCTFSGDKCMPTQPLPDEWMSSCNCATGGMYDPMSQACQDCKAAYDKYMAESTAYCQKQRDSQYLEFTLNVK